MSTPHFAAPGACEIDAGPVAEDVASFLSRRPRQLPSRYLYDDLGSALFEAICQLPWYGVTRIERRLVTRHARSILGRVGCLAALLELGPGSGDKMAALLDAAGARPPLAVHLVDISRSALETAARTLSARPALTITAHQRSYEDGLSDVARSLPRRGGTLALFLGSNIGNFDPPGAAALLDSLRSTLIAGDALLLGTDLVRPEAELLRAYDDPLGVTAAFNRNLLVRVNRELGADFDVDGFAHRALWNRDQMRVEMHLVSRRRQRVMVGSAGLEIGFDPGETIWTESSYKFRPEDVAAMLERVGFRAVDQWTEDHVALTVAMAV